MPKEICWFFDAEEMELGQVIPIKLIYKGAEFEGKIRNESSDRRRVRIFWSSDLSRLLAEFQDIDTAEEAVSSIPGYRYSSSNLSEERRSCISIDHEGR